jgi:MFS family permease
VSASGHPEGAAPAADGPEGVRDTVAVLRDPNVAPYLLGNLISTTGTWFHTLAQAVLVHRLTESTLLLGVVFFAQFAAVLVLAPWTGSVADRFERRRVIVISQLAAVLLSAALTLAAAFDHATTPVVIAFAVGLGVTSAFATPAMMAFVTSLVERRHLSTALALQSVTFNVGRVLGPLGAALVIDRAGTTWAFGINTFSYLGLVAGTLLVRPLARQARPRERPTFGDSIALVVRDPRLAAFLCIIAAVNLATDPATTLGPAFVSEVLDAEDSLAGVLVGAFGAGAVLAAFSVGHRLRGTSAQLATTLALAGLGGAAFALAPNLPIAVAALVVMGFGYLATNTGATTRLQLGVAEAERGRIMALWSIAFLGIRPIGSLVDGAIAASVGIRVAAFALALPALAGAAAIVVRMRASRPRTSAAGA